VHCHSSWHLPSSRTITQIIFINRLTPNDLYMGRTAPLTSKRCILYIYKTNVGTEYSKHALYSPFFSLQNAVCFIMLTCLVPVLLTFYIQNVLKLKNNSGAKGLIQFLHHRKHRVQITKSASLCCFFFRNKSLFTLMVTPAYKNP
jgi:hypothetical protein